MPRVGWQIGCRKMTTDQHINDFAREKEFKVK